MSDPRPMEFFGVGFFPKRIAVADAWLNAPNVERICSVSRCVSEGPDGWMDHWKHNEFGMFSSARQARAVVSEELGEGFEIHGYRLGSTAYDEGEAGRIGMPLPAVEPIPTGCEFLGFDAVGADAGHFPACSPLSCNAGASEFAVNRWCLLDSLEEACDAARRFSVEKSWEPGSYHVVEVWRIPISAPEKWTATAQRS